VSANNAGAGLLVQVILTLLLTFKHIPLRLLALRVHVSLVMHINAICNVKYTCNSGSSILDAQGFSLATPPGQFADMCCD